MRVSSSPRRWRTGASCAAAEAPPAHAARATSATTRRAVVRMFFVLCFVWWVGESTSVRLAVAFWSKTVWGESREGSRCACGSDEGVGRFVLWVLRLVHFVVCSRYYSSPAALPRVGVDPLDRTLDDARSRAQPHTAFSNFRYSTTVLGLRKAFHVCSHSV